MFGSIVIVLCLFPNIKRCFFQKNNKKKPDSISVSSKKKVWCMAINSDCKEMHFHEEFAIMLMTMQIRWNKFSKDSNSR